MTDVTDELTMRQAANEFRVSVDTIRRRVKRGSLPYRRKLGKIVVARADVESIIYADGPPFSGGPWTAR
jgi:predicted site-specific integrase-resolvase